MVEKLPEKRINNNSIIIYFILLQFYLAGCSQNSTNLSDDQYIEKLNWCLEQESKQTQSNYETLQGVNKVYDIQYEIYELIAKGNYLSAEELDALKESNWDPYDGNLPEAPTKPKPPNDIRGMYGACINYTLVLINHQAELLEIQKDTIDESRSIIHMLPDNLQDQFEHGSIPYNHNIIFTRNSHLRRFLPNLYKNGIPTPGQLRHG